MTGLFAGLKTYGGKWSVKATRAFTQEEIAEVASAKVVDSDYGLSCCFTMVGSGINVYIPMDRNTTLRSGDSVDLSKASIITLEKYGEQDIQRISI